MTSIDAILKKLEKVVLRKEVKAEVFHFGTCPDCGVQAGQAHEPGCDVERCSACGGQKLSCFCGGKHDPRFAHWTGYWPGSLEAAALGLDLNELARSGLEKYFFVKPRKV